MNLQQNKLTISDIQRDKLKLRQIVESLIAFDDYTDIHEGGNTWCIFHDDRGKKSAVWQLHDDDGVIRLWCYVCRKNFTVYDYIINVLQKDPLYFLLEDMTIQQLEDYINNFDFIESKLFYKKIDEDKIKNKGISEIVNYISFGE